MLENLSELGASRVGLCASEACFRSTPCIDLVGGNVGSQVCAPGSECSELSPRRFPVLKGSHTQDSGWWGWQGTLTGPQRKHSGSREDEEHVWGTLSSWLESSDVQPQMQTQLSSSEMGVVILVVCVNRLCPVKHESREINMFTQMTWEHCF